VRPGPKRNGLLKVLEGCIVVSGAAFRDGTVINESAAIETFKKALVKIGLDKVAATSIKHGDYGLVSKDKRPPEAGRIWQHKVEGWYVYVNISNGQKKKDLQQLSDMFGLGLVIEDGK
jgi:hypothetical protein